MKRLIILAAVVALVIGMTAQCWAVAEFKTYGSVRTDAGWRFTQRKDTAPVGGKSTLYNWFLDNSGSNSRIGFNGTVGEVKGNFELGLQSSSSTIGSPSTVSPSVSVRHMYAEWNMGGGSSLLFGQTWSEGVFGFTNQRLVQDLANIGFGCLYEDRTPQLRYTYASQDWSLKLAVEQPKGKNIGGTSDIGPLTVGQVNEGYWPEVWAKFSWTPLEWLRIQPGGLWQQVRFEKDTDAPGVVSGFTVDTWMGDLDARLKFPMFQIDVQGWIGQNLAVVFPSIEQRGNGTTIANTIFGAPALNAEGNDVNNVDAWGGFVNVLFPLQPVQINLYGGYQQSQTKNDFLANLAGDSLNSHIATWSVGANVLYNITDAFYIQPEIDYFSYGKDALKNSLPGGGDNLGSDWFIGVHFQADF